MILISSRFSMLQTKKKYIRKNKKYIKDIFIIIFMLFGKFLRDSFLIYIINFILLISVDCTYLYLRF